MYVADVDMSANSDGPSTSARPVSVPANGAVARSMKLGDAGVAGALVRQGTPDGQLVKDNYALKDELLRAKADLAVQSQDVLELRGKLAERDRSLQLTKSELIETRISLQEKEIQLQVRNFCGSDSADKPAGRLQKGFISYENSACCRSHHPSTICFGLNTEGAPFMIARFRSDNFCIESIRLVRLEVYLLSLSK